MTHFGLDTFLPSFSTSIFTSISVLADPSADGNFSYDDDDAGSGSTDILNAESPTVDLTAANAGGETLLTVSYQYNYNFGSIFNLEYFDFDASSWITWEAVPDNSFTTSNWCTAISAPTTVSSELDISGFSATQLSGFQYRFAYDASSVYGWGFCMNPSTLTSTSPPSCIDPSTLNATGIMAINRTMSGRHDPAMSPVLNYIRQSLCNLSFVFYSLK